MHTSRRTRRASSSGKSRSRPNATLLAGFSLLPILVFWATGCQSRGNQEREETQAQVQQTIDEMRREFTEDTAAIHSRITELRNEAQQAADNGNEELAAHYRDAASRLEQARNQLDSRWNDLRNSASENLDEARNRLTSFRNDLRSLIDTIATAGSSTGKQGGGE